MPMCGTSSSRSDDAGSMREGGNDGQKCVNVQKYWRVETGFGGWGMGEKCAVSGQRAE